MKRISYRHFIILLFFVLAHTSCDYFFVKNYRMKIPINNLQDGVSQSHTDLIMKALNIIDGIATKHGMEKRIDKHNMQEGIISRYYEGQYDVPGLISSKASVGLTVLANSRTKELTMRINERRKTQSQLSKDIERDLIDAMAEKYGEGSIVVD
jgi:hypothetical protein